MAAIAQPQFDNAYVGIRIEQRRIIGRPELLCAKSSEMMTGIDSLTSIRRLPSRSAGATGRSAPRLAVPAMIAGAANAIVRQKIGISNRAMCNSNSYSNLTIGLGIDIGWESIIGTTAGGLIWLTEKLLPIRAVPHVSPQDRENYLIF